MIDGPQRLRPPWTYSSAFPIISVLFGCCLAISGATAGLSPFLQRGEACLYAIAPPAEFVAKYAEGVAATGPHLSLFPFGAQCSYTAHATGEIAVSGVGLWPSLSILVGTALIVAGLLVATHRFHLARQQGSMPHVGGPPTVRERLLSGLSVARPERVWLRRGT